MVWQRGRKMCGLVGRMPEGRRMVKSVYQNCVTGGSVRDRLLIIWERRVEQYVSWRMRGVEWLGK